MSRTLAQLTIGNQTIQGPLDPNLNSVGSVVNRVTSFLIPISAVILLFVLILGGYELMMSRGEPAKVQGARAKITAGVVGFVLLLLSFLITRLIAVVFDLQGSMF